MGEERSIVIPAQGKYTGKSFEADYTKRVVADHRIEMETDTFMGNIPKVGFCGSTVDQMDEDDGLDELEEDPREIAAIEQSKMDIEPLHQKALTLREPLEMPRIVTLHYTGIVYALYVQMLDQHGRVLDKEDECANEFLTLPATIPPWTSLGVSCNGAVDMGLGLRHPVTGEEGVEEELDPIVQMINPADRVDGCIYASTANNFAKAMSLVFSNPISRKCASLRVSVLTACIRDAETGRIIHAPGGCDPQQEEAHPEVFFTTLAGAGVTGADHIIGRSGCGTQVVRKEWWTFDQPVVPFVVLPIDAAAHQLRVDYPDMVLDGLLLPVTNGEDGLDGTMGADASAYCQGNVMNLLEQEWLMERIDTNTLNASLAVPFVTDARPMRLLLFVNAKLTKYPLPESVFLTLSSYWRGGVVPSFLTRVKEHKQSLSTNE